MRNAVRGPIIAALALVLAACVPAPSTKPALMTEPAGTTFVVPKPTDEPAARTALTDASFSQPDIERELKSYFELFYKARTLPRGGQFDPSALRALVKVHMPTTPCLCSIATSGMQSRVASWR